MINVCCYYINKCTFKKYKKTLIFKQSYIFLDISLLRFEISPQIYAPLFVKERSYLESSRCYLRKFDQFR